VSGSDPAERPESAWRSDRRRYGRRPWLREQSIYAVALYRFGRWADTTSARPLLNSLYWVAYFVLETITGISISKLVDIGPGLRIHHFGPVVVHPQVRIGANCTLRHGVTIGNRVEGGPVPVVEDDVEFGAYAQAFGGIRIGRGARIGAMSVVLHDVPAGATVVGSPARVVNGVREPHAPA
jgi:serine O-acetyltransferase